MIYDVTKGVYTKFQFFNGIGEIKGNPQFIDIGGKLAFVQLFGSQYYGTFYFNTLDFEIILEKPQFFSNFIFLKNLPISELYFLYLSSDGLKYCDSPNLSFLNDFSFAFSDYAFSFLPRDNCQLFLRFIARSVFPDIFEIEVDLMRTCVETFVVEKRVAVIRCPIPLSVPYCCNKLDFTKLEALIGSNP